MQIDPTVSGCLSQIRRGNVAAVGVLADYLEEQQMTGAVTVRRYWNRYTSAVEWTCDTDFSRRKKTKWENIVLWRRWLRKRIQVLYGRKWKQLPLEKYK